MLKRVVVCVLTNRPDFVFGPFDDHNQSQDFVEKHEKICKRYHFTRKLNPPKVGVK